MSYSGQISIKNIIQDYINKSGHKGNLNEEYVYIAAEEALDEIITGDGYFEYIILLNLYNQKAELPANFKYPTQVAYRPPYDIEKSANDLKRYFISTINNNYVENVCLDACTSCKQTKCCCETKEWYPIETTDTYVKLVKEPMLATGYSKFLYGVQNEYSNNKASFLSELPHNKSNLEKNIVRHHIIPSFTRSQKCPEFQIVRPKSNYFFNLPNELKHCNLPSYDTNLEYSINNRIIQLNNYDYRCNKCNSCKNKNNSCEANLPMERHGEVLISYMGHKVDEEGFRMIPDELYVIKAVTDYIISYMAFIDYSIKRDQSSERYWMNVKMVAEKSIIQARSRYRIPPPDKMSLFLQNIWSKKSQYNSSVDQLNRFLPELESRLVGSRCTEQDYNNYSSMFHNHIH